MSIGDCSEVDGRYNEDDEIMIKCKDAINRALSECPYLSEGYMKEFEVHIIRGNVGATVALLVTLLPNLEIIEMRNFSNRASHFKSMIMEIAEAVYSAKEKSDSETDFGNGVTDSANKFGKEVLGKVQHTPSKLSHIHLGRYDLNQEYNEDLWLLAPFVGLPSVRSLSGELVEGCRFPVGVKVIKSNITRIEFTDSAFLSKPLDQPLQTIRALEHFKYHFCRCNKTKPDWEPRFIAKTLTKFHYSLESLDLCGDDFDDEHFIGSFRGFCKLRTIRVESSMFIEDSGQCKMSKTRRGTDYHLDKVYRLDEMLPASVETLTITDRGIMKEVAAKMLEGFAGRKKCGFPHLTLVEFEKGIELPEGVKDDFGEAGIHLNFDEDTDENTDEDTVEDTDEDET